MQVFKKSLPLFLFVALLAGCGVVATFIPPIEVGDVLGVDGQTVTATFGEPASALTTQVASVSSATFEQTFDDQELDLYGFSLRDFVAVIGLDQRVVLHAPIGGTFPDSFTLTHASISATLSDEVNGSATMTLEHDLELLFDRDEGSCGPLSCSYLYHGDPDLLAEALTLIASENDDAQATLRRFVDIVRLQGDASPNSGSFTISVEVDSTPSLAGFEGRFRLKSASTTIRLGG